ncbi:MAG: response regulator transcription factor [Brachymonas sp.]|nr:response regulator transcription factor [Brachymonas sp.]
MSLFVIEDHPLYREALGTLLRRIKPGEAVAELDRIGELPAMVKKHGTPEVICLDLTLSDTLGMSGIREVKHHYPGTLLVVVSEQSAETMEAQCLEAGADAYISKMTDSKEMYTTLRTLLLPDSSLSEEDLSNSKLSKRQVQLLAALDQGLSNRDIAERLGISEHTVKVHLWRLFRRLGVKSRTQAIHTARTNGLIQG